MDSKLYPPRAKHRQKRKRSSRDDTDNADNDNDDAAPASDLELDSILENSMAALASEDEQDVGPCCQLACTAVLLCVHKALLGLLNSRMSWQCPNCRLKTLLNRDVSRYMRLQRRMM